MNEAVDLQHAPLQELRETLHTSPQGLSTTEAAQRLSQYGYNELPEKEASPLRKFLAYFWGPIPWMIEAAIVLSAHRSWDVFCFP